jgi:peptide/nickel transport system substrate-binding protein
VVSFDPCRLHLADAPAFYTFYDTLYRFDDNYKATPQLAESWEIQDEGKRLVFKLRKGVTYHTGREMSADDVVFSLKRYQDKDVAANLRPLALFITNVKADDKSTVSFQMEKRNAAIMDLFDQMYIMDQETIKDVKTRAIGTGPFKFKSWIPGQKVVAERNPNYWKSGRPYLDAIEISSIPDAAALSVSLESGAVDMAERLAPQDLKRLQASPNLDIAIAGAGASINSVLLNVKKPPFNNQRLRAAVDLAINRDRFAQIHYYGFSKGQCLPVAKSSPGYFADQDIYEFNLDKARQLSRDAGITDLNVTMIVSTTGGWGSEKLAQIMQGDLKSIGINLKIEDVPQPVILARALRMDYECVSWLYGRTSKDPITMYTGARPFLPDCEQNITGFCSDRLKQLVDAGASTYDAEKRKPILRELNQLVRTELFNLPVAPAFFGFASWKKVQGFKANLDGWPILEEVSLS